MFIFPPALEIGTRPSYLLYRVRRARARVSTRRLLSVTVFAFFRVDRCRFSAVVLLVTSTARIINYSDPQCAAYYNTLRGTRTARWTTEQYAERSPRYFIPSFTKNATTTAVVLEYRPQHTGRYYEHRRFGRRDRHIDHRRGSCHIDRRQIIVRLCPRFVPSARQVFTIIIDN